MKVICISALENGAHENRTSPWEKTVPDGWAVIPDSITIPESFPFVDILTEVVDDVPTVISMTAREIPAAEKAKQEAMRKEQKERVTLPETVKALQAALDDMDAMAVDQEYRLTLLELGITNTDTSNT